MKKQDLLSYSLPLWLFLLFASSCEKVSDKPVPVLTTSEVTNVLTTKAECGGYIRSDGGDVVTMRGVCWSMTVDPTIADNKTEDGKGTGGFDSNILGLKSNTTYYVRAYAINSTGTAYGANVIFTTQEDGRVGTIVDTRDGNVYKTITIGDQEWMSENLAYLPGVVHNSEAFQSQNHKTQPLFGVYGYEGSDVEAARAEPNYTTYGVLYNWHAVNAEDVCPDGWHVSTHDEWAELENYLADNGFNYDGTIGYGSKKISKSLASESHWISSSNEGATGNTDYPEYRNKSGFSALPGGEFGYDGMYGYIGVMGIWWTAETSSINHFWMRSFNFESTSVDRTGGYHWLGASVRCVKDQ